MHGEGQRRPSHREEFCKKPKGTFGMAVGEELIIVVALCVCLCVHPFIYALTGHTLSPGLGRRQC